MYTIVTNKTILKLFCTFFLICDLWAADQPGQQEQSAGESTYDSKFFDQLRSIFGKFQNSDLRRVFKEAQPIQCSELVGHKGEWRSVAFFNEDRGLGDWYRGSLDEVKSDLAVFTFTGGCSGDQGAVQVGTRFPTAASLDAYKQKRIDLDKVDVTTNNPVDAIVNPRTEAYTFGLPLFRTIRNSRKAYSFVAPDRDAASATDVTSRWECKAVSNKDVTYRFLICRVATVPRDAIARNESFFGSSAFFILSDGTKAHSSVRLIFGDDTQPADNRAGAVPPAASAGSAVKRK